MLGFHVVCQGGEWGRWRERTPKAEGKLEAHSAQLSAWGPHTDPRTQSPHLLAAGKVGLDGARAGPGHRSQGHGLLDSKV